MNKPKNTSKSTSGLLIGLMFGFLVGLAMFKQTPKSERSAAFPYLIGIGIILCSIVGYKIGALNDDETYRDEWLGIKDIKTIQFNDANDWVIQSIWMQYNGLENKLITTNKDGEMISVFNEIIVRNHGNATNIRSGAKAHQETKNDLIDGLKANFKKLV
ncbi:hypothetical protein A5893_11425 [Pedobacter psychrophilus]|uniref:Uncharacterized protein n=1 Tax=Pedobacter psychrophilus TaxID=1826909 RepID=A0A179DFH9_9SPHI|nr:hypothetical protein [Pedobacter psychrophilus]OAQ39269.1 hypothetical protein A5893_11425 [Pedobacter psychrophilus]